MSTLFICIMAGVGFGLWLHSLGAAIFMTNLLITIWSISEEWRQKA